MRRIFKKTEGFTLIELLLYLALFSIFLIVLLQLFTGILDVQRESQSTSAVAQDARYLLSRFSYDIEQASSIQVPTVGNSSATLQMTVGGISYTYSLVSGNLMFTTPSGADRLNSSDTAVSSLTFTRTGNSSVTISFTLTSLTIRRAGQQVETFQTTVAQRIN